jgi:7,8-dihydropterin-6-yl-methyl-4-(beta-D-ribofuranosyl)aminobenzene 5'-phosphate synthase
MSRCLTAAALLIAGALLAAAQLNRVPPDRAHVNNEWGDLGGTPRGQKTELEIRVIYDNTSAHPDFQEDWGFAALVTYRGKRILFDSGTKPDLFLENLKKWKVKPSSIHATVISHQHQDHRNGVYKLYPQNRKMPVFFLENFEQAAWDEADAIGMKPVRVTGPVEIMKGVNSTGPVEGDPFEQALVIETSDGPVMLVGCSHPGVVKLVETVQRQRGLQHIRLLIGGFHMFRQDEAQIREQIQALDRLNVQRVLPAHCTGDPAKALFYQAFGDRAEPAGAGKLIRLPVVKR